MPAQLPSAREAYTALHDHRWSTNPAAVGAILDEIAKEADTVATVWRQVVKEFVDGHFNLTRAEFRTLCERYGLSPIANAPPFYRLVEFYERFFHRDTGPSLPATPRLANALQSFIWGRNEVVELVDVVVAAGVARAEDHLNNETLLKQLAVAVESLEKDAAAIHVLAAEVRMLPFQQQSQSVRVLFLAANAISSTRLALDEEYRDIKQKIRSSEGRDFLELTANFAVRPEDLQQALLEEKPTVVHFSGHGAGELGLVFHGESDGAEKFVGAPALEHLFSILTDNIRLVVLNACYSDIQAKALVKVIDFVVGMNASIGDKAARKFAASFYVGLGFGRTVSTAFQLGVNAIMLEGLVDDQNVPVLHVRSGISAETTRLVSPPG